MIKKRKDPLSGSSVDNGSFRQAIGGLELVDLVRASEFHLTTYTASGARIIVAQSVARLSYSYY